MIRSVEIDSSVNRPLSRKVWPRPNFIISASSPCWIATKVRHATAPATAKLTFAPNGASPRTSSAAPHAPIIVNAKLKMLNVWMYHGYRIFSHSGRCMTIATSASISGGSSRIAGIRNTGVMW
jgi:hypothetical protein